MKINRTVIPILLPTLVFVFVSCSRNESTAKKQQQTATSSALPESSEQLLALLPKTDEVAGWSLSDKPDEKPRFFGPGNLWEYIDGGAESYLAYGFQEVVTADYYQGKTQLTVDVYRMKDITNTFGIYAQERNPDSQFVKVGVEGYLGGTTLNFWAGVYYVKIVGFAEQEALKQEMLKIAARISDKLTNPGAEPAQITWFPKQNQVARTVKYIPKDVLGQSYFANAFEMKYKAGSSEYKLMLMELQNAETAKEALAKYRRLISNQRKEPKDLSVPGADEGFSGQDSFYGRMMAIRAGTYLVVALGVPSSAVGNSAVVEILNNIKTKAGNPV